MGKLLKQLEEYLSTATKEQLDKDWEELKHWNEISPLVEISLKPSCDFCEEAETTNETSKDKELIICAAIRCNDKLYKGHRHNHCITALNDELSWKLSREEISNMKQEQGFITSKNRFVDRKEAYEIAKAADQLLNVHENWKSLFSEDLY